MKQILFLLLPFAYSVTYAMQEDEDKFSEQWKIKKLLQISPELYIKSFDFNAENKKLLVEEENQAILYNWNGQSIGFKHKSNRWKPSFDPTNLYIITSPKLDEVALSDTSGKEIMTVKTNSANKLVKFNAQGNQILTAASSKTALWNMENGKQIAGCKGNASVKIAKFFPHNEALIFIAYFKKPDRIHEKNIMWDTRSNEFINYKHINSLEKVDIHPEGNYLACILSGCACVYDVRAEGEIYLPSYKPHLAKFNKTGTYILTYAGLSDVALLWNTRAISQYLTNKRNPDPFTKIKKTNLFSSRFHPREANRVLIHSMETIYDFKKENSVSIWDINGKELAMLPHEKRLSKAKFDSTGEHIISKDENNVVRVWKNSKR